MPDWITVHPQMPTAAQNYRVENYSTTWKDSNKISGESSMTAQYRNYTRGIRSTRQQIRWGVNTATWAGGITVTCIFFFFFPSLLSSNFSTTNSYCLCDTKNKTIRRLNQKQKHKIGGLGVMPWPPDHSLVCNAPLEPLAGSGSNLRSITGIPKPQPQTPSLPSESPFASCEPNWRGFRGVGGVLMLKKKSNSETNSLEPQTHTDRERQHPFGNDWVIFQLSHIQRSTDKLEGVRGGDWDNERSGKGHRRVDLRK